jgi:hypothetical protein
MDEPVTSEVKSGKWQPNIRERVQILCSTLNHSTHPIGRLHAKPKCSGLQGQRASLLHSTLVTFIFLPHYQQSRRI